MPAKKTNRKPARKTTPKKPSFGRAGTAGKAEGDAGFRAWLKGIHPEHRAIAERLDALIQDVVPDVKRAIKWSMPQYGRTGIGWFINVGSFKEHVGVRFFAGTSLNPIPPYGEGKGMRAVNLRSLDDLDEQQMRSWIKQAAAIKGWGTA